MLKNSPLLPLLKKWAGFATILVVIFIDGLGSSMILPLLPSLFEQSGEKIFFFQLNGQEDFFYALSMGIFPLAMFFGAPFLGRLSDFLGRKRTIAYCLIGTSSGYFISGMGIYMGSVGLFILGRLLDGITAGSLPIAQALLIENRPHVEKQTNIALALFFASAGYAMGPLIGNSLQMLSSGDYGLVIPLYGISFLSIACLLCLKLIRENSFNQNTPNLKGVLSNLIPVIKGKNFTFLIITFICYQLGWSGFFQYLSKYLCLSSRFSSTEISIVLSLMGVGMGLSFCYLVKKLSPLLSPKKTLPIFGIIIFTSFSFILLNKSVCIIALFSFLAATAYGLGYPNLVAILSTHANKDSQGFIFGLAASISSLSALTSSLFGSITRFTSIKNYMWVNTAFFLVFIMLSLTLNFLRKINSEERKQIIQE